MVQPFHSQRLNRITMPLIYLLVLSVCLSFGTQSVSGFSGDMLTKTFDNRSSHKLLQEPQSLRRPESSGRSSVMLRKPLLSVDSIADGNGGLVFNSRCSYTYYTSTCYDSLVTYFDAIGNPTNRQLFVYSPTGYITTQLSEEYNAGLWVNSALYTQSQINNSCYYYSFSYFNWNAQSQQWEYDYAYRTVASWGTGLNLDSLERQKFNLGQWENAYMYKFKYDASNGKLKFRERWNWNPTTLSYEPNYRYYYLSYLNYDNICDYQASNWTYETWNGTAWVVNSNNSYVVYGADSTVELAVNLQGLLVYKVTNRFDSRGNLIFYGYADYDSAMMPFIDEQEYLYNSSNEMLLYIRRGNDYYGGPVYVLNKTTYSNFINCNSTIGIDEINRTDFSLFPSPVNSILQVSCPAGFAGEIYIFNSLGQQVSSLDAKGNIEINTADFRSGIYWLCLVSPTGSYSKKFIVQHD